MSDESESIAKPIRTEAGNPQCLLRARCPNGCGATTRDCISQRFIWMHFETEVMRSKDCATRHVWEMEEIVSLLS